MISIKNAFSETEWLSLRSELWPHCPKEQHLEEMKTYLSSGDKSIFLAFHENTVIGFCECSIRHDYVEGSTANPTAYLEGIFVAVAFRKQRIATNLLQYAEIWAKKLGCHELGSDANISNQASIDMHLSLGFIEKSRIVHFIKSIR